jgi:regulatory protein
VGLERLAPEPGGEPTPTTSPPTTPTPTQAWGATAKKYVEKQAKPSKAERRAEQIEKQIAQDPTGYARQVCLELLEHAPRTRQELAKALAKKGVPDQAAEEVLARFTDVGIIDDALFASMWVTSRHRGKGLAGRALSQELRRKGVDDELVREAVGGLDPAQEEATARQLVRRKLNATRGLATDARIRRLAGMLARKGYSGGLAFRVVKEELEAEGVEVPELDTDGLSHLG